MTNQKPIRYFYTIGDKSYSITDNDETLIEESIKDKQIDKYNYFQSQKGYECTLESLIQYRKDFNEYCKEIEKEVNYKKYYNHNSAVEMVFQSKSKRQIEGLHLDKIIYKEFALYEKCPKSGLMTFDEEYKDKEINCYGYDYSAFYPNCLLKMLLATKQGKRKKLKTLDFDNLQYGIYHIKITCDDKRFKKIFMFSKQNHYAHYCLKLAYEFRELFNIKFELVVDDKYNALVYDDEKLVHGSEVFGTWFKYLSVLKTKFPKNKLVKRLMSSLWGSLTAFNRKFYDDIVDLDISEIDDDDETEYKLLDEKRYKDNTKEYGYRSLYYCIPSSEPYKNNLARLKPFLVSFCRSYVARTIIKENLLDHVVRIHTDGIVLNKEHNFSHLKYYPKPEDKTTGTIKFSNVINYEKVV